ncbi:MAG: hypothetical protein IIZ83_06135 [Oscillospiraceae bacterium]|nr:hypothetical protein [Oscillospiraceae bacterium]
MVEFINTLGTRMWVADDRVEEYKAAGHKLAAEAVKPAEAAPKKTAKTRKK